MSRPAFVQAFVDSAWSVENEASLASLYLPASATAAQWTDTGSAAKNLAQATGANQPVATTLAGKAALQYGLVSAVRRFQSVSIGSGDVQDCTVVMVLTADTDDTNVRTALALSANSEIQIQGLGTSNENAGLLLAVPAPAGARVEPALANGAPYVLTFVGDGTNRKLYPDGYDMWLGGNASSVDSIATMTVGNANTPADAKAAPIVVGYIARFTDPLSATTRAKVEADVVNFYDGVQVILQGNSQSSNGHVTSTGEQTVYALKKHTTRLVYSSHYSTGGKQTPQMVTDFDSQVKPLINYLVKRRVYVMQEGENDLFTNGRDDVDVNSVTYAEGTAVTNDKALSSKASAAGAGVLVKIGIPPTTAGTVGGGGGSDTPLNYEASRLANDAYWRASAKYVYQPWNATFVENGSPVLDPSTGLPFFTYFVDAFSTSSTIGTTASLLSSGKYEADRQHLNTAGVDLLATWLAAVVDHACAAMAT